MYLMARQNGKPLQSGGLLSHQATKETDFSGLLLPVRPLKGEAKQLRKSAGNLTKAEDTARSVGSTVIASMTT